MTSSTACSTRRPRWRSASSRRPEDRPVPGTLTRPLLLARHGQTADNAGGLILGRRDPPLSDLGRTQAQALAVAVAARQNRIAAIWSSPLRRARATAAIVSE